MFYISAMPTNIQYTQKHRTMHVNLTPQQNHTVVIHCYITQKLKKTLTLLYLKKLHPSTSVPSIRIEFWWSII